MAQAGNLSRESKAGPMSRIAVAILLSLLVIVSRSSIALAAERVVAVSMRDGVTIETYVRTPSGDGPWPAVLKKGYGITKGGADTFTDAGYAFVAQGVRGGADPHGISGNARFFADDVDGYDTIEWIASQPWCDGNVAMFGPSYYGATQWLAAANGDPGPPPHLRAIIPSVINPDFWERAYRAHGAMNLSMTAISRAFDRGRASYDAYMHLPLIDMDKAVGGRENTLWNEYVSHWTYDDYWAHIGMRDKYRRIRIPVYISAGWWDYYSGASLKYYNLLREAGHTSEIRVWIGDSGHSQMALSESIRWLDWVIKGEDNGLKDQPPVRLFVQGVDQERYYDEWPPSGMQPTRYYLHSPDGSRSGTLGAQPPGCEPPTRYTYDPRDPVPSIGGNANHRGINRTLKSGAVLREGSFDQRPVENRDDVLVFTTPALEADVEVIGPVSLRLYAATDARDTDFTAVLIDVLPDGKAMNVTEGILRARFRESIWEAPKLLEAGQVYEYTLELLPTARVFRKGHRIRVHLSSSRFPLWDRNTNTGNDPATDTQIKVARQTIHHDAAHPSHLVLPIIPRATISAKKSPPVSEKDRGEVTWTWVPEEVSPLQVITVKSRDDEEVTAVLRKPPGDGPFPAVVFLHGGLRKLPLERLRGAAMTSHTSTRYLAAGYVTVRPTFRDRREDPQTPKALWDCIAVAEHVRNLPYVDPGSVVAFGGSGGGSLALELAGEVDLAAVVGGEPATCLFTGLHTRGAPNSHPWLYEDPKRYYTPKVKELTRAKLRKIRCPVLIVHCDRHPINILNNELIIPEMKALGKPISTTLYPGSRHGFYFGSRETPEAALKCFQDTSRFFAHHTNVKPKPLTDRRIERRPIRRPAAGQGSRRERRGAQRR